MSLNIRFKYQSVNQNKISQFCGKNGYEIHFSLRDSQPFLIMILEVFRSVFKVKDEICQISR